MSFAARTSAAILMLSALAAAPALAIAPSSTIVIANRRSVTVYAPGSRGNAAPAARIAAALVSPAGIAADLKGNIYLTLPSANAVLVYPPGANADTGPAATIAGSKTQLMYPMSIAADSAGNIYVANDGSENAQTDSITVYPPRSRGNVAPIRTISGPDTGLGGPHGIALDSGGNLYVANDNGNINIYAPGGNGNIKPQFAISGLATAVANAIAVDSSGNIYVAAGEFFSVPARLLIYRPGAKRPIAQIFGPHTSLSVPHGIAVDTDFIYVTNNPKEHGAAGNIALYPSFQTLLSRRDFHDWAPVKSISGTAAGLNEPWGVALKDGKLAVANRFGDSVTVYSRKNGGNTAPVATITDNLTRLSDAAGIALDAAGNMYVADSGAALGDAGAIRVYPPGADGDARPSRAVAGAAARLSQPTAIALDSRGYLVVANRSGGPAGRGSVDVYPACGNSDIAPAATISGSRTGLDDPDAVTLDSDSNIYIANYLGGPEKNGSITIYRRDSNGNAAPAAAIAAPASGADRTKLGEPVAIALDSRGNIYVANDGGFGPGIITLPSINIYAAGSRGNAAPTTVISGSAASLYDMGGIAVDPGGNIYAINRGNSVIVFAAPRRGVVNRASAVTIAGGATRLDSPQGIALAPSATRMPACAAR